MVGLAFSNDIGSIVNNIIILIINMPYVMKNNVVLIYQQSVKTRIIRKSVSVYMIQQI
jgi:hypothetical protein